MLNDGATDVVCFQHTTASSASAGTENVPFDFIVKLEAGHSIKCESDNGNIFLSVIARQIASIDGELTNP